MQIDISKVRQVHRHTAQAIRLIQELTERGEDFTSEARGKMELEAKQELGSAQVIADDLEDLRSYAAQEE